MEAAIRSSGSDPNKHQKVAMINHNLKKEQPETYMDDDEDNELFGGCRGDDEKKKRVSSGGSGKKGSGNGGDGGASMRCCQADKCSADLNEAKQYHKRHKVCETHAKAQAVIVAGIRQRFCQQCSRFHEISEFDEAKRSCRRRLAGHNERRRKNSGGDSSSGHHHAAATAVAPEGPCSSRKIGATTKEIVCGQVDDRGRFR